MKNFCYKIHENQGEVLLAICDLSIIGKTIEDNNLKLVVSEEFYKQEICDEEHIKKIIKGATIINLIGKDIISVMLNEKIIEKDRIMEINGVPHAQIICIKK